jgi:hypothetical protein
MHVWPVRRKSGKQTQSIFPLLIANMDQIKSRIEWKERRFLSKVRYYTFVRLLVVIFVISPIWTLSRICRFFAWVNYDLCDFPGPIGPSKSSLQILWLLPENTQLETKRSNEGKTESERTRRGSASRASEDSNLPLYLAG